MNKYVNYIKAFRDLLNSDIEVFRDEYTIIYYCKDLMTNKIRKISISEENQHIVVNEDKTQDIHDYIVEFWNNCIIRSPKLTKKMCDLGFIVVEEFDINLWEEMVLNKKLQIKRRIYI